MSNDRCCEKAKSGPGHDLECWAYWKSKYESGQARVSQLETEITVERVEKVRLREALAQLALPCTRMDYTVSQLDEVVTRIAQEALAFDGTKDKLSEEVFNKVKADLDAMPMFNRESAPARCLKHGTVLVRSGHEEPWCWPCSEEARERLADLEATKPTVQEPHVHYAMAGCTCLPCAAIYQEVLRRATNETP